MGSPASGVCAKHKPGRAGGGVTNCVLLMLLAVMFGFQSEDDEQKTQHKVKLTEIEIDSYINKVRVERLIKSASPEGCPDRWPNSIDDLDPKNMTEDGRRDAWDNKYRIRVFPEQIEVRSAGPNGTFNDSDDIVRSGPIVLPVV